jgi:predicted dehydrogenase
MKSPAFDSKISRRQFLTVAGATLAFPTIIPSRALGRDDVPAPSQRIALAVVGCGNQGTLDTKAFLPLKDCQIVAACDVDKKHLEAFSKVVNTHYKNEDCKTYHDFRELMARADVDAVLVAVPDNWHELVEVEALRHKKDVYGEKPLAHSIAEQQAIVKAVQENGRIFQTGSQQRSEANFRKACEIVRNGLIGDITHVEVGLPDLNRNSGREAHTLPNGDIDFSISDPPPELDYETWVGPAKMMPYRQACVHRNWRWNYNTGGGQIMDWIGHHCDIAHWGCDFDNSGPSEIEGHGELPPRDAPWNTATKYQIELQYPRNITMTISSDRKKMKDGVKWIGTKGWVWVNRGAFESSNPDWSDYKNLPDDLRKVKLYVSSNHHQNFLDCVKSRQPTIAPANTGHHSAIPGHLSVISLLVGRKIKWDAKTETILDDAEASQLLTRPFRAPWKLS